LLDIGLPNLNGIEVARQIRKLSPKTKILFVTQESSADVITEALSLGAMGYVIKDACRKRTVRCDGGGARRHAVYQQ
jgi:DNA-binding NarL/FixJ family response regulator